MRLLLLPFSIKQLRNSASPAAAAHEARPGVPDRRRRGKIGVQRVMLKLCRVYEQSGVSTLPIIMLLMPFAQLPVTFVVCFGVKNLCTLTTRPASLEWRVDPARSYSRGPTLRAPDVGCSAHERAV